MANYQYKNETGVIVPDTADILTEVQDEYKAQFGQDLIVTANTPQGILITSEALARTAVVQNNAQIANQINPNLAIGVFLDAILQLLGSQRTPATFTLVTADLTGQPGTFISAGAQAQNSVNGEFFQSVLDVTLDGTGNGSVNFQAVNSGPINCNANDLNIVAPGAPIGWETVNNPDNAIFVGSEIENDEEARNRRNVTLAAQSTSLSEAIITGVRLLPGVESVGFRENTANTTEIIDGITMVPHSIFVCVDGGNDQDIAEVLNSKKSGGCAYNGDITVPVTDPFSGQAVDVKFSKPNLINILVRATITADAAIQDPVNTVKNAILAYVNGELTNEPGLVVGQDVSAFELAGAVNIQAPTIFVNNMEISLFSPLNYSSNTIPIGVFEKANIIGSSISVILL